jgi:CheY-like chemotaxis protein
VTPKLLVADDSITIQRVIELTFADEDVQVVAVGDGQQAIERVRSDRPDIVLADVGMPERDGYEVAAFIKNDPQLAHIPVLLLTGAFEPVDEVRARAVGCDGVLVKPFEPQMVISRVRDLLAGQRESANQPQSFAVAPPRPQIVEPPAGSAFEEAAGSLEDYFDRLDAALASKHASTSGVLAAARVEPPAAHVPREPVRIAPAPVEDPKSVPVHAVPSVSISPEAVTSHAAAPVAIAPVTPPQASAAASSAPPAPAPISEEAMLQQAFSALLSVEEKASAAPAPKPEVLTADVIDDIVGRVIARMGDESMKAAVLDAAERLVREEIARIKSQS